MSEEKIPSEHEVPELVAPFIIKHVAQIVDSRLTDGEYRLLDLIVARCTHRGSNFASLKTYSDDLGIDESTVKRRLSALKDKGYLRCERRGLGQTWVKVIVAPSKNYDPEVFTSPFSLMRSDRSVQDIARLRSLDNDRGGKSEPNEGGKNEPSQGSDLSPRTAQKRALLSRSREVDQDEVDQALSARSAGEKDRGSDPGPDRTSTKAVASVENQKKPDPEEADAARAAAARATLAAAQDRAAQVHATERQRRQQRLERREHATESARVRKAERFSTSEGKANARHAELWFKQGIADNFGSDILISAWDVKELTLAKKLIVEFGADLVKTAIKNLCTDWEVIYRSKFKNTTGLPTIAWLYSMRNMVFSDLQLRQRSEEKCGNSDLSPDKKFE